jgi:hypothetical protein
MKEVSFVAVLKVIAQFVESSALDTQYGTLDLNVDCRD